MTTTDYEYMTDRELERQRRILNQIPEEFQEYDSQRKICIAWFVIFVVSFVASYILLFR